MREQLSEGNRVSRDFESGTIGTLDNKDRRGQRLWRGQSRKVASQKKRILRASRSLWTVVSGCVFLEWAEFMSSWETWLLDNLLQNDSEEDSYKLVPQSVIDFFPVFVSCDVFSERVSNRYWQARIDNQTTDAWTRGICEHPPKLSKKKVCCHAFGSVAVQPLTSFVITPLSFTFVITPLSFAFVISSYIHLGIAAIRAWPPRFLCKWKVLRRCDKIKRAGGKDLHDRAACRMVNSIFLFASLESIVVSENRRISTSGKRIMCE